MSEYFCKKCEAIRDFKVTDKSLKPKSFVVVECTICKWKWWR